MSRAERITLGVAVVAGAVWLAVALAGTKVGVGVGVVTAVAVLIVPAQWRILRTSHPDRVPPWLRR